MITVETIVNATIETVWNAWTEPKHITGWYFASTDWHAPLAENDLKVDGKFKTEMAAKDGSFAFDFEGIYTSVIQHKLIEYILADGRKVNIIFIAKNNTVTVTEQFDPENENPQEMQKQGWQAILNNFKLYVEKKS